MSEIGRVFEVRFDADRYQAIMLDGDDELTSEWRRSLEWAPGVSISGRWSLPPLYVDRPMRMRSDILHFWDFWEGMVLSERAVDVIGHLALMSGELLPLPVEGEQLQVLNVTEVINCLNRERTIWNEVGTAKVPAFHAHRIAEVPLFRIPENNSARLYCWEGLGEESLEFKRAVEMNQLSGLTFTEAWNTEVGGIPDPWRW